MDDAADRGDTAMPTTRSRPLTFPQLPPMPMRPTAMPPPPIPADDIDPHRGAPMEDAVIAAAAAAIPAGLLARIVADDAASRSRGAAGRVGAMQASRRRGRPAGVRRDRPSAGARLDLMATLRAAVPWQRVRGRAAAGTSGRPDGRIGRAPIRIRAEDFHVGRFKQRGRTTTIFAVDASGSSALHRLAEAKGAVELLLADCYVRRDSVAVVGFRGRAAELLLPPTRSLVRAKRSLAELPGGGGTPLAAGFDRCSDAGRCGAPARRLRRGRDPQRRPRECGPRRRPPAVRAPRRTHVWRRAPCATAAPPPSSSTPRRSRIRSPASWPV